jgi:UDP-glucose 4-epimerase
VYGDGEQRRAFSDIKYYMKPLELLATQFDNDTFNIGADNSVSLNEVAHTIKEVAYTYGFDVPIEYREQRHEVKDAFCNHDKAKELLKFKDTTDLKSVIEDMFEWAIAQPVRSVKTMEYEVSRGIYSFWK